MAAKPKPVIIVGILAAVIAAVAAYFLYNYLKTQEERVKQAVAVEKVVAASEGITVGTTITDKQLKIVDWPKANLPVGTFQTTEQVVGRTALDSFSPGDPITESKLVPKEAPAGILSYKIPEGHRAMTVAVDQVAGVAGFINPGNMVDVVLTVIPASGKQSISKIVLQNVPILAIGQIIDHKGGTPELVPTVTMDVTPDEAEKLAIASSQGVLQLVLRRMGDKEEVRTVGATVTKVLSGASTKVSVSGGRKRVKKAHVVEAKKTEEKPKEVSITVDVFRGGLKTSQQFTVK